MDKRNISGVKKGGHKGWGTVTDYLKGEILDEDDPMYDIILEEKDFFEISKQTLKESQDHNLPKPLPPIQIIVNDFLSEGSTEEAIKSIQQFNLSLNALQRFFKRIISYAIENHAYERELTSQLISALVLEKVLENEMPQLCFDNVLENISDIILDTPDAVNLIAKFILRAISDEVIPPSYLKSAKLREDNNLGRQILNEVQAIMNEPAFGHRCQHIWGVGDFSSVKRLKKEARTIFQEYIISEEKEDALQALRELGTPAFNFQVVTLGIRVAIESQNEKSTKKILNLISFFLEMGYISKFEISKGFQNCEGYLKDLSLDVPTSTKDFEKIKKTAQSMNLL